MSITDSAESSKPTGHHDGADFQSEADEYLAKRTLRKGTAGWLLLAGLGVSYVISGDYAGWNNGLDVIGHR